MSQTATNAPKNGLKGLAIERRFSSPGTHPFDETEWEIRDAVIGDPAAPAFEQRGVEFPKSWSQNATNIVAQKYFRGQLTSPTRERSVKQMISRVASGLAPSRLSSSGATSSTSSSTAATSDSASGSDS